MMQSIGALVLSAVILSIAVSGCGGGCNKAKDEGGQPCQVATPENGGKYVCPEGSFCKYAEGDNMSNGNTLGKCEPMAKYEPCMTVTLCGSADYSPKCETINETAYCDWYKTSLRCRCEGPGPFVEGEQDGDLKTPTTTK